MKMIQMVINEYSNNYNVSGNQNESLADYILRITREQDISLRKVEERAKAKGFQIAQSYLSKIISGAADNLSVEKIQALAAGLNRPEEEVFAVARGESLAESRINDALANAMFFKYAQLGDQDKSELATLLRALDREIEERLAKQKK